MQTVLCESQGDVELLLEVLCCDAATKTLRLVEIVFDNNPLSIPLIIFFFWFVLEKTLQPDNIAPSKRHHYNNVFFLYTKSDTHQSQITSTKRWST